MKEIQDILLLDRVVHEPARLAILAVLATVEIVDFKFLQNTLQLTQGDLSTHISKLENAGLVVVEKSFVGKRVSTELRMAPDGQIAFDKETAVLQKFLDLLET